MDDQHIKNIRYFYQDYRRMPNYREIMDLTGFKSKNAVYKLINRLTTQGLIEKDLFGKLIPKRLFNEVPLVGRVAAGFPSPAEEYMTEALSLDEYLIEDKEATYLFKVEGDSMIEEGIMPGDMVLVERKKEAKDGDIVIALVDQEWTLKYFRKADGKVYLEAANKNYEPIFPKEELTIAAVVRAVIRKY
jgi:repressor LexA